MESVVVIRWESPVGTWNLSHILQGQESAGRGLDSEIKGLFGYISIVVLGRYDQAMGTFVPH